MALELDLSRMMVLPGRKLAGIAYDLKVDKDTFAAVADLSAKHGFVPLYANFSTRVYGRMRVVALMDMTDADISIEGWADELRVKCDAKVLGLIKPVAEGILIDNLTERLTAGEERAIILRSRGYRRLIDGIKEQFGSGGELFLYCEGIEAGKGFGRLHRSAAEAAGIKDPIEIYRRVSIYAFQWAGFGRMDVIRLGYSGGKIVVHGSFECEGARRTREPYGAFVKGIIAGVFTEVFGKPFRAEETECIAKGDPACVFEIKEK